MPRVKLTKNETMPEKNLFSADLKQSIKNSIKSFLHFKKHFTGRSLSVEELLTEDNVNIVRRTEFDDQTFLFIHENCLSKIEPDPSYRDITVSWSVHYLLGLLADLKSLQLPQGHQPGLLLLYFKFCKGFEIPPVPIL